MVTRKNPQATAFYFETILVLGDAMVPGSLRVEDERSPFYYFDEFYDTRFSSSFVLPENMPYFFF